MSGGQHRAIGGFSGFGPGSVSGSGSATWISGARVACLSAVVLGGSPPRLLQLIKKLLKFSRKCRHAAENVSGMQTEKSWDF